jgi:GNAT superfamily N-acetyltransferase
MRCATRGAADPVDAGATDVIEDAYRAWFRAHDGVPGMEVHASEELTWMWGPGVGWSNCGVRVRLRGASADRKLASVVERAFAHGRGFGMWISDNATPDDVPARLARLGFRNRKRFPGMRATLKKQAAAGLPRGVELREVEDHDIFKKHPHPYFGRITTAVRRFEMQRVAHLVRAHPKHVFDLMAVKKGVPVGIATLHLAGDVVSLHDVGVLETARGQGIGSGLVGAACSFARARGARDAILLASGMGYGVYLRAGFRDACRIGYFYSAGGCS